jgi:hypothetical protein
MIYQFRTLPEKPDPNEMHVIMITLLFQKKKSTGGSYLDQ